MRRITRPLGTILMVGLIVYVLVAGGIAFTTLDDCGKGAPKHWSFIPPEWVCDRPVR